MKAYFLWELETEPEPVKNRPAPAQALLSNEDLFLLTSSFIIVEATGVLVSHPADCGGRPPSPHQPGPGWYPQEEQVDKKKAGNPITEESTPIPAQKKRLPQLT